MEKGINRKRRQNKSQYLAFLLNDKTSILCRCIQNLNSSSHRTQEVLDEKFYWKEKLTDIGNDKHGHADSLTQCK